ncbi:hypothetical protein [uncultured Bradyrhizobium sp.]
MRLTRRQSGQRGVGWPAARVCLTEPRWKSTGIERMNWFEPVIVEQIK